MNSVSTPTEATARPLIPSTPTTGVAEDFGDDLSLVVTPNHRDPMPVPHGSASDSSGGDADVYVEGAYVYNADGVAQRQYPSHPYPVTPAERATSSRPATLAAAPPPSHQREVSNLTTETLGPSAQSRRRSSFSSLSGESPNALASSSPAPSPASDGARPQDLSSALPPTASYSLAAGNRPEPQRPFAYAFSRGDVARGLVPDPNCFTAGRGQPTRRGDESGDAAADALPVGSLTSATVLSDAQAAVSNARAIRFCAPYRLTDVEVTDSALTHGLGRKTLQNHHQQEEQQQFGDVGGAAFVPFVRGFVYSSAADHTVTAEHEAYLLAIDDAVRWDRRLKQSMRRFDTNGRLDGASGVARAAPPTEVAASRTDATETKNGRLSKRKQMRVGVVPVGSAFAPPPSAYNSDADSSSESEPDDDNDEAADARGSGEGGRGGCRGRISSAFCAVGHLFCNCLTNTCCVSYRVCCFFGVTPIAAELTNGSCRSPLLCAVIIALSGLWIFVSGVLGGATFPEGEAWRGIEPFIPMASLFMTVSGTGWVACAVGVAGGALSLYRAREELVTDLSNEWVDTMLSHIIYCLAISQMILIGSIVIVLVCKHYGVWVADMAQALVGSLDGEDAALERFLYSRRLVNWRPPLSAKHWQMRLRRQHLDPSRRNRFNPVVRFLNFIVDVPLGFLKIPVRLDWSLPPQPSDPSTRPVTALPALYTVGLATIGILMTVATVVMKVFFDELRPTVRSFLVTTVGDGIADSRVRELMGNYDDYVWITIFLVLIVVAVVLYLQVSALLEIVDQVRRGGANGSADPKVKNYQLRKAGPHRMLDGIATMFFTFVVFIVIAVIVIPIVAAFFAVLILSPDAIGKVILGEIFTWVYTLIFRNVALMIVQWIVVSRFLANATTLRHPRIFGLVAPLMIILQLSVNFVSVFVSLLMSLIAVPLMFVLPFGYYGSPLHNPLMAIVYASEDANNNIKSTMTAYFIARSQMQQLIYFGEREGACSRGLHAEVARAPRSIAPLSTLPADPSVNGVGGGQQMVANSNPFRTTRPRTQTPNEPVGYVYNNNFSNADTEVGGAEVEMTDRQPTYPPQNESTPTLAPPLPQHSNSSASVATVPAQHYFPANGRRGNNDDASARRRVVFVALSTFGEKELYQSQRHLIRLWVLFDHFPERFPRAFTPRTSLAPPIEAAVIKDLGVYVDFIVECKMAAKRREGAGGSSAESAAPPSTPASHFNVWFADDKRLPLRKQRKYRTKTVANILMAHGLVPSTCIDSSNTGKEEGTKKEEAANTFCLPSPQTYASYLGELMRFYASEIMGRDADASAPTDDASSPFGVVGPQRGEAPTREGRGTSRIAEPAAFSPDAGDAAESNNNALLVASEGHPILVDPDAYPPLNLQTLVAQQTGPQTSGGVGEEANTTASISPTDAAARIDVQEEEAGLSLPLEVGPRSRQQRRARKKLRASLLEEAVFDMHELLEEEGERKQRLLETAERRRKAWLIHALEHPDKILIPIEVHADGSFAPPAGLVGMVGEGLVSANIGESPLAKRIDAAKSSLLAYPTTAELLADLHFNQRGRILGGGARGGTAFLATLDPKGPRNAAYARASWRWRLALTLMLYPSLRADRKHYLRRHGFTPERPLGFDPLGL